MDPDFPCKVLEKGRSRAIGRIALIGIDLKGGALIDLNVMQGFVGTRKARMKGVCRISADEEATGQCAAIVLAMPPCKAAQDLVEDGSLRTLMAFTADFLVVKKGNYLSRSAF